MGNQDRISEVYKGDLWSDAGQRRARERVNWLCSHAEGRVLDVGCSQGIASILVARGGLRVVGVDVEFDRLQYAMRDRAEEPAVVANRCGFVSADGGALPFPDGTFQTILLGEVLEHLIYPERVLREAVRVGSSDARVLFTVPHGYNPHHDHYSTFYAWSFVRLLQPYVTVDEIEVVDDYIRVVARSGAMSDDQVDAVVLGVQEAAEAALVEKEANAHRTLQKARKQAANGDTARAELAQLRKDHKAALADLAQLRRQHSDLKASSGRRLAEVRARADQMAARAEELRFKADTANWRLRRLQSRRAWRIASVLRQASRDSAARSGAAKRLLKETVRTVPAPPAPVRRPVGKSGGARFTALTGSPAPSVGDVAPVVWPNVPPVRPGVTAAVILDPFSASAFRFEWKQIEVTPADWRETLAQRPDLLFVESAWRGNGGAWNYAMTGKTGPKPELVELVEQFRAAGVPTVFWNKEDPPNYDVFLATARLFDHVFTVDADRIPNYVADLGHDRVSLLPFGAQPRIHNPVQVDGGRSHSVAFAGTYFSEKHDGRRDQMETVLKPARDFGLHIYSRMQGADDRYNFPAEYASHIVGTLPYEAMLTAYKMYDVFLNVNSVTESPSMCARRVFELSACSTPVLSGWSRAVESFFGPEAVAVTRTPEETAGLLEVLLRNEEVRDRMAHRAYQIVYRDHTFGHRVDEVLRAAGLPTSPRRRHVSAVVPTNRPDQLDTVLANAGRQVDVELQLVLVLHGLDVDVDDLRRRAKEAGVNDFVVRTVPAELTLGAVMNEGLAAADGDYVAKMDDDNFYGPRYLSDLLHPFSYTDAGIVGKWSHYAYLEARNCTVHRFPDAEHRYVDLVQGGTIVAPKALLSGLRFDDVPRAVDTTLLRRAKADGVKVYAADRFNFVSVRRSDTASHTWKITDAELMRRGRVVFFGPPQDHVVV